MPKKPTQPKPKSAEQPRDEGLSSSDLFSDFRRMLKDAYWQSRCPSVDVQTRYLVRLSLTEEQNELWDKVMNPKENARGMARELAAQDSESPTKQNG